MHIDAYQQRTSTTAIYPDHGQATPEALLYAVLGLCSEAGELAGKVKKMIRDGGPHGMSFLDHEYTNDTDMTGVHAELGDVLWYAARVATESGTTLSAIAADNLHKLNDRKDRGIIGGSGDNR